MEENKTNAFMSAEINEIAAALSEFQGSIEQPVLNKENPYFKSRYVDLSGVLKAAQPKLVKYGLSVAQIILGDNLVTLLAHKSGQWMKSHCPIGSYKSQQDRGSAITYAKRYALCAMLGIAADTDDDGNSAVAVDKARGGITPPTPVFTGEQLKQGLAEVEAATSEKELKAIWAKWGKECPSLVANGTEFYKALTAKIKSVREAK